jgi:hypothetical protein
MERAARAGGWLGGRPPFGYKLAPFTAPDLKYKGKRLAIDEEQAKIVREIFMLCEQGRSASRIADQLNLRGIPHPIGWHDATRNRRWYQATVAGLLRNPLYVGEWTWRPRKTRQRSSRSVKRVEQGTPARPPAIITRAQFDRVQALIDARKRFAPRNSKRTYLARGLVVCGACGRNFLALVGISNRSAGGAHLPYYRCASHVVREASRPPCGTAGVRADFLDSVAWQFCAEFIRSPDSALAELRELLTHKRASASTIARSGERRASHATRLARLKRKRERLVSLVADGTLSRTEARTQLEGVRREIESSESEAAREERERVGARSAAERIESIARLLERLREGIESANDARKVEIVRALVESVTVIPSEEKHPRLRFVFRFSTPQTIDYDEHGTPRPTQLTISREVSGWSAGNGRSPHWSEMFGCRPRRK